MQPSFLVSLCALPILALTAACVDTGDLFGGNRADSGGGPSTGGSPETGAGTPNGGAPTSGGGDVGGAPPGCGDGDIDAGEECDGANLNGQDCTSFGSANPAGLTCTANCNLDSSGCAGDCGNGSIEAGEACDDGNKQPNDGCSVDCVPELGNCAVPEPVSLSAGTTIVSGSTGGDSLLEPSPGQNCDGGPGPEKVFQVTPSVSGYLTAYLPSQAATMDTVLYARSSCDASAPQRLCNDNFGTPGDTGGEVISFHVEAGVPVFIVVDGFEANEGGSFDLSLDLSDGDTCADPVPLVIEGDAPIVATGNTVGETSDGFSDAICNLSGYGPDIIYAVTVATDSNYDFDITANGFNSVIHARTNCESGETQIDCDAPPNTNNSSIGINLDGGSTTFIYADGSSNNAGPYSLTVSH